MTALCEKRQKFLAGLSQQIQASRLMMLSAHITGQGHDRYLGSRPAMWERCFRQPRRDSSPRRIHRTCRQLPAWGSRAMRHDPSGWKGHGLDLARLNPRRESLSASSAVSRCGISKWSVHPAGPGGENIREIGYGPLSFSAFHPPDLVVGRDALALLRTKPSRTLPSVSSWTMTRKPPCSCASTPFPCV